jgi:hypothetical protein
MNTNQRGNRVVLNYVFSRYPFSSALLHFGKPNSHAFRHERAVMHSVMRDLSCIPPRERCHAFRHERSVMHSVMGELPMHSVMKELPCIPSWESCHAFRHERAVMHSVMWELHWWDLIRGLQRVPGLKRLDPPLSILLTVSNRDKY